MILMDEMTPTRDNIIIDRLAGEKETKSGIILKTSDGPDRAKVVAIGPKVDEVEIGDELLLNWNGAVKIANERYVIKIEHVVLIY